MLIMAYYFVDIVRSIFLILTMSKYSNLGWVYTALGINEILLIIIAIGVPVVRF
jgi:hypothetical protein